MAQIDDGRAQFLAGQARLLRADAIEAAELLRRGRVEEAAIMLDRNQAYLTAIAHELTLLTKPRESRDRGGNHGRVNCHRRS